jgi:hypothetical protein
MNVLYGCELGKADSDAYWCREQNRHSKESRDDHGGKDTGNKEREVPNYPMILCTNTRTLPFTMQQLLLTSVRKIFAKRLLNKC